MCYGKQKDGEENQYYFPPFLAKNTTSIQRWGERPGAEISDERFTDKNAMNTYALSTMQADPITTMSLTYDGNDPVLPGEVWYLRVEPEQFDTDVEVTGITDYPFAPDHKPEIELDNSVKTLLDEDVAQERAIKIAIKDNQTAAKQIKQTSQKAAQAYDSRFIGDLYGVEPKLKVRAATLPGYILRVPADNPDLGLKKDQQFYAATAVDYVAGLAEFVDGKIPEAPSYDLATPSDDGLMSATDKAKLDKLKIEPLISIQMKDAVSGSIYQLAIENGEIKLTKGGIKE